MVDRYEPGINRTYEELATHYGAVVVPARVFKPKDKAKVESAVQVAQRWILAVLRHRTFFSLAELNEAIWEKLEVLNARPMQKLGVSRRELYERLDRPVLKPLPQESYELSTWKRCRVNIDYHVEVENNLYSVPYQLIHEKVEARVTASAFPWRDLTAPPSGAAATASTPGAPDANVAYAPGSWSSAPFLSCGDATRRAFP